MADRCWVAEIEPFDAKLAQRVQSLSAQIEGQTLQLAKMRRDIPAATAKEYEERSNREGEEDEAYVEKYKRHLEAAQEMKLDLGNTARLGEMEETWQQGTEELEELKWTIGRTVAKMERAKRSVDFVEERE